MNNNGDTDEITENLQDPQLNAEVQSGIESIQRAEANRAKRRAEARMPPPPHKRNKEWPSWARSRAYQLMLKQIL